MAVTSARIKSLYFHLLLHLYSIIMKRKKQPKKWKHSNAINAMQNSVCGFHL